MKKIRLFFSNLMSSSLSLSSRHVVQKHMVWCHCIVLCPLQQSIVWKGERTCDIVTCECHTLSLLLEDKREKLLQNWDLGAALRRTGFSIGATQCEGYQLLWERAGWRNMSRHAHVCSHFGKMDAQLLLGEGRTAPLPTYQLPQTAWQVRGPREQSRAGWLPTCSLAHLPAHFCLHLAG